MVDILVGSQCAKHGQLCVVDSQCARHDLLCFWKPVVGGVCTCEASVSLCAHICIISCTSKLHTTFTFNVACTFGMCSYFILMFILFLYRQCTCRSSGPSGNEPTPKFVIHVDVHCRVYIFMWAGTLLAHWSPSTHPFTFTFHIQDIQTWPEVGWTSNPACSILQGNHLGYSIRSFD